MSSKVFAQACQIGGAIERKLVTPDDVAKFVKIGQLAAAGNNEAIEVQAACERDENPDLGVVAKLLAPKPAGPGLQFPKP